VYLQPKGELIEGRIVHMYRQGKRGNATYATLDTGHVLRFTPAMLKALCPVEGSVMRTEYGFPRHDEHMGKYYSVSRRWKRIKAYECDPIQCKQVTMTEPIRVKTFSIADGWK
jgi:hypothetical protein